MLRILHIELLKLRRSTMLWVSMFGVGVAPLLNYLIFLSLKSNDHVSALRLGRTAFA